MLFVGVDGGTGDVEAVVLDERGRQCGRGEGGPSRNPAGPGMHPTVGSHLVHAISGALTAAGARAEDVLSVSLNLSGEPSELTLDNARVWLAPLGLPERTRIAVEEDGLSAWAAGGFPDPAIWVLLGTHWGSGGMLRGDKVEHPLDRLDMDAEHGALAEGANVGTWALGRAVHAGLGGSPTRLYDAYVKELGARDVQGLIDWARQHTNKDERADLYRVASETAARGDPVARELFEYAGVRIGEGTVALGRYMGLADRPVTVLLTGKAWRAGGVLLDPFTRTTLGGLPEAEVRINRLSQAQGSALLAMRHARCEPPAEVSERLAEALD